jgi:hypothetical protein
MLTVSRGGDAQSGDNALHLGAWVVNNRALAPRFILR